VLHLERPLRPRPFGSVGGTMISRSSSSSGAPEGDGRGGYTRSGRDQYSTYRGAGGSVGRLGVVGGGTSVDSASAMAAECTAQRRSFFQQRGQERRLPDAPSDGVIRSASLQHHPSLSMSSSSSMMAVSAGTTALSSSTSAIHGTNHIHHRNQRHHSLNRSMSNSSGVACISSSSIPTSASKSTIAGGNNNNNTIRQLKKTVRFDADEDEPATTTAAAATTTTTTTISSSALPSRNLKANGLLRSESSLLASSTVADASWKGDNKTWDWLMKGHSDGDSFRHHHQDSRESAGRDSGVETLTSGEDVVIVVPRSKHHSASHDQHRPKVKQQRLPPTTGEKKQTKKTNLRRDAPSPTPLGFFLSCDEMETRLLSSPRHTHYLTLFRSSFLFFLMMQTNA